MLLYFAFETNEAQYSRYRERVHDVPCDVPDSKPVYWPVVKPPLDAQHGGINKESRVCDVRCKTSIHKNISTQQMLIPSPSWVRIAKQIQPISTVRTEVR